MKAILRILPSVLLAAALAAAWLGIVTPLREMQGSLAAALGASLGGAVIASVAIKQLETRDMDAGVLRDGRRMFAAMAVIAALYGVVGLLLQWKAQSLLGQLTIGLILDLQQRLIELRAVPRAKLFGTAVTVALALLALGAALRADGERLARILAVRGAVRAAAMFVFALLLSAGAFSIVSLTAGAALAPYAEKDVAAKVAALKKDLARLEAGPRIVFGERLAISFGRPVQSLSPVARRETEPPSERSACVVDEPPPNDCTLAEIAAAAQQLEADAAASAPGGASGSVGPGPTGPSGPGPTGPNGAGPEGGPSGASPALQRPTLTSELAKLSNSLQMSARAHRARRSADLEPYRSVRAADVEAAVRKICGEGRCERMTSDPARAGVTPSLAVAFELGADGVDLAKAAQGDLASAAAEGEMASYAGEVAKLAGEEPIKELTKSVVVEATRGAIACLEAVCGFEVNLPIGHATFPGVAADVKQRLAAAMRERVAALARDARARLMAAALAASKTPKRTPEQRRAEADRIAAAMGAGPPSWRRDRPGRGRRPPIAIPGARKPVTCTCGGRFVWRRMVTPEELPAARAACSGPCR